MDIYKVSIEASWIDWSQLILSALSMVLLAFYVFFTFRIYTQSKKQTIESEYQTNEARLQTASMAEQLKTMQEQFVHQTKGFLSVSIDTWDQLYESEDVVEESRRISQEWESLVKSTKIFENITLKYLVLHIKNVGFTDVNETNFNVTLSVDKGKLNTQQRDKPYNFSFPLGRVIEIGATKSIPIINTAFFPRCEIVIKTDYVDRRKNTGFIEIAHIDENSLTPSNDYKVSAS